VGPEQLFAVAFGLWAGVVGLSVRLVLSRLFSLDERLSTAEKTLIRIEVKGERA
jgi:hypothetical protein